MAKAVTDIRDFLSKARRYILSKLAHIRSLVANIRFCLIIRKDAKKLLIKKNKDGSVKFKIRCSRVSSVFEYFELFLMFITNSHLVFSSCTPLR